LVGKARVMVECEASPDPPAEERFAHETGFRERHISLGEALLSPNAVVVN
jgi:hypothetical protein